MKSACITGITGQDGVFLTNLLLEKGYKVYGLKRRSSSFNTNRIDPIINDPIKSKNLELIYGDLSDYSSILSFVGDIKPDLFFNLGAMSHVRVSFDISEYTLDVTGIGVLRCLEAIRKASPNTKFLTASSSEMFGSSPPPQNEETKFQPQSPYAIAKTVGYYSTINYRNAYKIFASNAISFNHESQFRGETFVTRKITRAAARIKMGLQDALYLGNRNSLRDWGYSEDYCRAMIMILELENPDDFCIATGEMHSVQEFVELVFSKLDLDWKEFVKTDERYFRPTEVDALCGDPSKLKKATGWEPKYTFEMLIDKMIENDLQLAKHEKLLKDKS